MRELNAPSSLSYSTADDSNSVHITEGSVPVTGGVIDATFAAHSVTQLTIAG